VAGAAKRIGRAIALASAEKEMDLILLINNPKGTLVRLAPVK